MSAFAGDGSVSDHQGSNQGIGTYPAEPAPRQRQGARHESLVVAKQYNYLSPNMISQIKRSEKVGGVPGEVKRRDCIAKRLVGFDRALHELDTLCAKGLLFKPL